MINLVTEIYYWITVNGHFIFVGARQWVNGRTVCRVQAFSKEMDKSFKPKLWEYVRVNDIIKAGAVDALPPHYLRNPNKVVAMLLYSDSDLFGPGFYLDQCPPEPTNDFITTRVCGKRGSDEIAEPPARKSVKLDISAPSGATGPISAPTYVSAPGSISSGTSAPALHTTLAMSGTPAPIFYATQARTDVGARNVHSMAGATGASNILYTLTGSSGVSMPNVYVLNPGPSNISVSDMVQQPAGQCNPESDSGRPNPQMYDMDIVDMLTK